MRKEYSKSSDININDYSESTIQTALYIYLKMKNKQLDFQKNNPGICRERSMRYVEKLKNDPVRYQRMLDKNKERYWKKKAAREAEKDAKKIESAEKAAAILAKLESEKDL